MPSPITRIRPRCSTKDCPIPYQPESHFCAFRGLTWHHCGGTASHQHRPRGRSTNPEAKIRAIICIPLHMAQDQGFKCDGRRMRDEVKDGWYRIYDRDTCELLGETPDLSAIKEGSDE